MARARCGLASSGYSPRARSHPSRVFQIGSHLSEQRRRLGLTLAECESATRIREKYLAALEEDRLGDFPDPAYVRIFLRGYATFLGLDAGALLSMCERSSKTSARGHRKRERVCELSVCLKSLGRCHRVGVCS